MTKNNLKSQFVLDRQDYHQPSFVVPPSLTLVLNKIIKQYSYWRACVPHWAQLQYLLIIQRADCSIWKQNKLILYYSKTWKTRPQAPKIKVFVKWKKKKTPPYIYPRNIKEWDIQYHSDHDLIYIIFNLLGKKTAPKLITVRNYKNR